ncbi:MAG: DUF1460 domain-containing protein [Tannerella sp.]|jgi:hypothetical protein|nr:DUF1460 domain-containing protein [Tannerella sp.]
MIRLRILLLPVALLLAGSGYGQTPAKHVDCTDEDVEIWNRCAAALAGRTALPAGELILEAARCFMDRPYVASTLEKEPERLVVNLRELDCTTFVETAVAMALAMKDTNPSFESFCRHLQTLRYRDSVIRDYTDRLHYFSDWIFENSRRGLVSDVTRQLGGEPLALRLSFMSSHPDLYRQLKSRPERIRTMQEKEAEISSRDVYALIPPARISDYAGEMRNGDIVCFVTSVDGLDVSHLGFVCFQGDTPGLLHASSAGRKVMVDSRSLQEYAYRSARGIIVVRIAR